MLTHHLRCCRCCCLTRADGQPVCSEGERKAIYEVVKSHLMGTSREQQQLAAAGAGSYLSTGASAGSGSGGSIPGGSGMAVPVGGSLQDTQHQSLLRALSGKWKFG